MWGKNDFISYDFLSGITKGKKDVYYPFDENYIYEWNKEKILHRRTKPLDYIMGLGQQAASRIIIKDGQYEFDTLMYWKIKDEDFEERK